MNGKKKIQKFKKKSVDIKTYLMYNKSIKKETNKTKQKES